MGLIYLILIGGVLGWIATIVFGSERSGDLQRNCASGIAGALTGGLLISPLFEKGNLVAGGYDVDSLLIALIVSASAIASVNLLQRREFR